MHVSNGLGVYSPVFGFCFLVFGRFFLIGFRIPGVVPAPKRTRPNGGRFWYRAVFLVLAHEAGSAFFVARTCDFQMLTFWEKGSARRVLLKGF